MIPKFTERVHPMSWGQALKEGINRLDKLLEILELDPLNLPYPLIEHASFPFKVPLSYVQRMHKKDPWDPLLLQVLPRGAELIPQIGYQADPLQESQFTPMPGLLHKYHGRALLLLSGACPVHCRYCFRREFPYADHRLTEQNFQNIFGYLTEHSDIHEVILSGGEPLMHQDHYLENLLARLSLIPHIKTCRIHTRMPVMIPARITEHLLKLIRSTSLRVVIVLHINHAQELDASLGLGLERLADAGATLLNHSVLLKDINDSVDKLKDLSFKLFQHRVLPYYLNCLDKVSGSQHFEVTLLKAQGLMTGLISQVPGYLMPRLVQETAAARAKVPIPISVPIR